MFYMCSTNVCTSVLALNQTCGRSLAHTHTHTRVHTHTHRHTHTHPRTHTHTPTHKHTHTQTHTHTHTHTPSSFVHGVFYLSCPLSFKSHLTDMVGFVWMCTVMWFCECT